MTNLSWLINLMKSLNIDLLARNDALQYRAISQAICTHVRTVCIDTAPSEDQGILTCIWLVRWTQWSAASNPCAGISCPFLVKQACQEAQRRNPANPQSLMKLLWPRKRESTAQWTQRKHNKGSQNRARGLVRQKDGVTPEGSLYLKCIGSAAWPQ